MADFVAVLKKTISSLPENNAATRARVYGRARSTIEAKLAALSPQPPEAIAERQRQALENAIREVEAAFAPAEPVTDPMSDTVFDEVFSSFSERQAEDPSPAAWPEPEPIIAPPVEEPEQAVRAEPEFGMAEPDDPDTFEEPQDQHHDPVLRVDEATDTLRASAEPSGTDGDGTGTGDIAMPPRRRRASGLGRWLVAAALLLALVGAGFGAWTQRDSLMALFGDPGTGTEAATSDAPEPDASAALSPEAVQDDAGEDQPPEGEASPEVPATTKFTQRLTEDGTEIDEGPAGEPASIGEGTSVASATQQTGAEADNTPSADEPAPTNTPSAEQAVPVGQQAMFYEERTANTAGTADTGSTVWSVVQESPGAEQPPEPAIRAEVTIPSRDLQLRLTIRRNADPSLPASHIIEMIFLTPDDFAGGGIDNVLRIAMKPSEQDAGNPLFGMPAKIADGFFLVALSDRNAELEANTTLMRRDGWIDIPIVYKSGRRALVTMEKGIPGEEAFNRAFEAWKAGSSG